MCGAVLANSDSASSKSFPIVTIEAGRIIIQIP